MIHRRWKERSLPGDFLLNEYEYDMLNEQYFIQKKKEY
jgi:hypothetical protein